MIRVNGRRVYLHRHIFETHVRPLEPNEIVHHKDENKRNNAPDNLEALSGRAAHLYQHNYHKYRDRHRQSEKDAEWAAMEELGIV